VNDRQLEEAMRTTNPTDHILVRVQREWNGWQKGEVRLGDLQNIHWLQPERAHRPLLHAYISCASIIAGEIPHNCERTKGPHTLLVCVLKRHSTPSVYAEIARRAVATADARAERPMSAPSESTLQHRHRVHR